MKKISSLLVVSGLCAALTGCSKPVELTQNTVYLSRESSIIKETLIDQVGQGENLSVDELTAYIDADTDFWNDNLGEGMVTVDTISIGETGDIRIEMSYQDYSGYAYSHNQTFYYGTVTQAMADGIPIPDTLKDRNGDDISTTAFTLDGDNYFIVLFSEPVQILTDKRIMGASANVTITGKTTAQGIQGENELTIPDAPAYLICKAN